MPSVFKRVPDAADNAGAPPQDTEPICITSIDVYPGQLDAHVRCAGGAPYVSAHAARRVCHLLPGLADQLCVHSRHERFGDEVCGTEIPHLLEHVAIELQVLEARAYDPVSDMAFHGVTLLEGDWPSADETATCSACDRQDVDATHPHEACVRLTFENDLIALAALKHAAEIVTWAWRGDVRAPDVRRIVKELGALRQG
jgi:hypothetical protein